MNIENDPENIISSRDSDFKDAERTNGEIIPANKGSGSAADARFQLLGGLNRRPQWGPRNPRRRRH